MPDVWSVRVCCVVCCVVSFRACCVAWCEDLMLQVFVLLFQVSKWVCRFVVLEAVRIVHVIICKCAVQRGVAQGTRSAEKMYVRIYMP